MSRGVFNRGKNSVAVTYNMSQLASKGNNAKRRNRGKGNFMYCKTIFSRYTAYNSMI